MVNTLGPLTTTEPLADLFQENNAKYNLRECLHDFTSSLCGQEDHQHLRGWLPKPADLINLHQQAHKPQASCTHANVLHRGLAGSGWPFHGSLTGSYWQTHGHSRWFNTALLISRTWPWWCTPCVREDRTKWGLLSGIQTVKTKV